LSIPVVPAPAGPINNLGEVDGLGNRQIGRVLDEQTFQANQAALFTYQTDTYLALNDSQAGFNSKTDAVILLLDTDVSPQEMQLI